MREIKFRAWDTFTNQWIEREGFHLFGEVMCFGLIETWLNEHPRFENEERLSVLLRFNDVITPQYTGLLDKNGVEIFEGDILRMPVPADNEAGQEIDNIPVTYSDGFWSFINQYFQSYENDREIIGNIYENPELLK